MVLLRRVLGDALRQQRLGQSRTLREVSTEAKVSLGYLSEVERGQKEASSELLASICDALGVHLSDVLRDVSGTLALAEQMPALGSLEANGGDGASTTAPSGVRTGADGAERTANGGVATKVGASRDTGTVTNSVSRTVADPDTALDTALSDSGLVDTVLGNELAETTLASTELASTVDRPGEVRASLRQVVAAA